MNMNHAISDDELDNVFGGQSDVFGLLEDNGITGDKIYQFLSILFKELGYCFMGVINGEIQGNDQNGNSLSQTQIYEMIANFFSK